MRRNLLVTTLLLIGGLGCTNRSAQGPTACRSDQDCPAEQGCSEGACKPKSAAICVQGSAVCQGQVVVRCDATGAKTSTEACREPSSCVRGACEANRTCDSGHAVCLQNVAYTCTASGALSAPTDCGGDFCVQGACVHPDGVCPAGASTCRGQVVMACDAQGTSETAVKTCGSTELCVDGACMPLACSPGAADCAGGHARVCNALGTAYFSDEACVAPAACINGRCQTMICAPGRTCDGDVRVECSSDGTQVLSTLDCAPRRCEGGECRGAPAEDAGVQDAEPKDAEVAPDSGPGLVAPCPGGRRQCGLECVDIRGDPSHCDGCGRACPAGNVCDEGTCRVVTDCRNEPCAGFTYCDLSNGQCVRGCNRDEQCGSHESCDLGRRVCSCHSSFARCEGRCVPLSSPQDHPCPGGEYCDFSAGACASGCGFNAQCPAHATCLNHACACDRGYHACGDACLIDSATASCGDRCAPCPAIANSRATCDSMSCGVECLSGYLMCSGACAPCRDQHAAGDRCGAAACLPAECTQGFSLCDDACVAEGERTCGIDCRACAPQIGQTAECQVGACVYACNPGSCDNNGVPLSQALVAIVHYRRPNGDYTGWQLSPGGGTRQDWDGQDRFGVFFVLPRAVGRSPLTFELARGTQIDGTFQLRTDLWVETWINSGDSNLHPSFVEATGVFTVHFRLATGSYQGWDLRVLQDAAPLAGAANPLTPASFDAFGAVFEVPVTRYRGAKTHRPLTLELRHNGVAPGWAVFQVIAADYPAIWLEESNTSVRLSDPTQDLAKLHLRRADGNYSGWQLRLLGGHAGDALIQGTRSSFGLDFVVALDPSARLLSYRAENGNQRDLDHTLDLLLTGGEAWVLDGDPGYLLPRASRNDGCESVETTCYKDADHDGFTAPSSAQSRCRCDGEWTSTESRSPDCDDTDERAHPGQTRYFDTARRGGGFDFNCDGNQEKRWIYGDCEFWGHACLYNQGWKDDVVPACGQNGYLYDCSSFGGGNGSEDCLHLQGSGYQLQECR